MAIRQPYNTLVLKVFTGGSLFLLEDSSAQHGVTAALGIPTHDSSDGSVSNSAVVHGSFRGKFNDYRLKPVELGSD